MTIESEKLKIKNKKIFVIKMKLNDDVSSTGFKKKKGEID